MSFDMIKTFNYFKLLLRWRKRIFHQLLNFGISKFLVNNSVTTLIIVNFSLKHVAIVVKILVTH